MREIFDFVAAFVSVVGSSTENANRALFVDVSGIASIDLDDPTDDDEAGEVSPHTEAFNALGVLARPLPPQTLQGKPYACDVLAMRTSDGLVPIAWRDLRLNQAFPNGMPEGRVSLVGYGGGYHTIDLTSDGQANSQTLYVRYANGAKAMAIVLDAENEHLSMSIGSGPPVNSGYQFTMSEADGLQIRSPNPNSYIKFKDDEIHLVAKKIIAKGNCYLGSEAEAGVVLAPGSTSPPGPSIFISPS